jgi:hypothetical protein
MPAASDPSRSRSQAWASASLVIVMPRAAARGPAGWQARPG